MSQTHIALIEWGNFTLLVNMFIVSALSVIFKDKSIFLGTEALEQLFTYMVFFQIVVVGLTHFPINNARKTNVEKNLEYYFKSHFFILTLTILFFVLTQKLSSNLSVFVVIGSIAYVYKGISGTIDYFFQRFLKTGKFTCQLELWIYNLCKKE